MHQELERLQDENICILKKDLLSYYCTHLSFPKERKQRGDLVWDLDWDYQHDTWKQNTFQEVFKKQNKKHSKKHKKIHTLTEMAEENHEHKTSFYCKIYVLISW